MRNGRVASLTQVLIRHAFNRFFDREAMSPQGDPQGSLAQLLGLLAVPGAFLVLVLRVLTLAGWHLVLFRYLFVSFSMVAMAMLVVLHWDALFPDRRDYLIFTPLPVGLWRLLLAKVAALGILLAVFLVDINLITILMWPGIDNGQDVIAIMGVHATVLFASGLCSALMMAAVQGLLVTCLSGSLLRKVSVTVQTLLIGFLVALFFATPLLASQIEALMKSNSRFIYWYPPYWFIGWYEQLRPATRHPVLMSLGPMATGAIAAAGTVCALTYLPGYRRHARRTLDAPAAAASGPGRLTRWINDALDRAVFRGPTERAIFHFINQTITRSVKHRYFLAAYGGFGAALALMNLADHSGVVRVSLTLSFILISGLRAAFSFPSELAANWTFQTSGGLDVHACLRAMRKWIVLCALLPLFAIFGAIELRLFDVGEAAFHLAFGLVLALVLIEVMFIDFRKAPFTCSYFPGKFNLVGLGVIYILGFTIYSGKMAALDSWLVKSPMAAAIFFAVALALLASAARLRRSGGQRVIEYEDSSHPVVRTLGLEGR